MDAILQITEVLRLSDQGTSGPYVCKAEDGKTYFVKGLNTGRQSQICEVLCWHLATAFGLPAAPAAMLEMSEDLWEELPREDRRIGKGLMFGSCDCSPVRWLEVADIHLVPEQVQRDLLVFDLWICNDDRGEGNTNLLWEEKAKKLVVIDHNRAFAPGFSSEEMVRKHIFSAQWEALKSDLVTQAEYASRLSQALPAWDDACHNLPFAWNWANDECDLPVDFDIPTARARLNRCLSTDLWRTS